MGKRKQFTGVPFQPMKKCLECSRLNECQNSDSSSFTAKEILIDCEAFYFAFKCLEEIEKRPVLNGNLGEYTETVRGYNEMHKSLPNLTPPFVANGTLAAELALKFLIFKETAAFDCIHNLKKLYEQLPEQHKTVLTDRICSQSHQNIQSLDFQLTNIANHFEDFRYFFGKSALGFSGFLMDFIHIVCDYALSFKPEYKDECETEEEQ